jgi:acyl-CoA thioester hydrolase
VAEPFRYLLRVRYAECDAQGIVFNARWGDYIDVAATEFQRAVFASVDPAVIGMDWQLVKQTIEWRAPARYDDVLEIRVHTERVGTTSFTLVSEFRRYASGAILARGETTYVVVDLAQRRKRPVTADERARFERGAPGCVIDHAGAGGSAIS